MNINKYKLNVLFILIIIFFKHILFINNSRKKVGVIGLEHSQNIGNNLLKYAMSIKLFELGYSPYFIGQRFRQHNISFIENAVNCKLINNFSEINEDDYDFLMVNSDQTWKNWTSYFYDIAFLKFAEKWKKPKFIYGTSLGDSKWVFSKNHSKIAKQLLKDFTGISVREKDSVELINKTLGFKAIFVLDPTLLIDKKFYLRLNNNFKSEIFNQIINKEYIFSYILKKTTNIEKYFKYVENNLNMKVYYITIKTKNQVNEFIYGISHSKAVITDSYHGTIFSIIFKKPFISFIRGNDVRFNSLNSIFNIKNRIYNIKSFPPIALLKQNLILDESKLKSLKKESINYLKQNLYYKS